MRDAYTIGRMRGGFALVFYVAGVRKRYSLRTNDASEAKKLAPAFYAELTRPKGSTVAELWDAYSRDKPGRVIVENMKFRWVALRDRFGTMQAEAITIADCRAHTEARRKAKISDGTILTELAHLRLVLRWAEKHKLIARAPFIECPPKPRPKEHHLTREQARALIQGAVLPHVRLYIILALGTGARNAALLQLTWARCDFTRGLIDLRNPDMKERHKGRAIVPMNRTVREALEDAHRGAMTDYVVEWAGEPVLSVKRGLKTAAAKAGVGSVSPHLLRHSAAVHMVEAGRPMEEIAQFLGHANTNTTREVYARFSPTYLREAAAALEYDDLDTIKKR